MLKYFSILLISFFLEGGVDRLIAFALEGPFNHQSVTLDAIKRFERKHGFELNFLCTAAIIEQITYSDAYFPKFDSYHCDNNNILGCSYRFRQVIDESEKTPDLTSGLVKFAIGLHIIHDMYAHSNWVENFEFSMILPPVDLFNAFPPPHWLQTGFYPDIFIENPEAQANCFTKDGNVIKNFIYGATHGCLNKDSWDSFRGGMLVPNSAITYHTLAGEYAIRHTEKAFETYFLKNPKFKMCIVPRTTGTGCNSAISEIITRQN